MISVPPSFSASLTSPLFGLWSPKSWPKQKLFWPKSLQNSDNERRECLGPPSHFCLSLWPPNALSPLIKFLCPICLVISQLSSDLSGTWTLLFLHAPSGNLAQIAAAVKTVPLSLHGPILRSFCPFCPLYHPLTLIFSFSLTLFRPYTFSHCVLWFSPTLSPRPHPSFIHSSVCIFVPFIPILASRSRSVGSGRPKPALGSGSRHEWKTSGEWEATPTLHRAYVLSRSSLLL